MMHWIARTPAELKARLAFFEKHVCERGDFPIAWKLTKHTRSLDQNALLHVWCTDYVKHLLRVEKPTAAQREAMKITLKRACYAETGWSWLIESVTDLFTGEVSTRLASSASYDVGEMHSFLDWIQRRAADDGLILQSMGEFQELRDAQTA
jgi:hypothetical protein